MLDYKTSTLQGYNPGRKHFRKPSPHETPSQRHRRPKKVSPLVSRNFNVKKKAASTQIETASVIIDKRLSADDKLPVTNF